MPFVSTIRALRSHRGPVERALAAASSKRFRDELVSAATVRAGNPPRL